MFASWDNNRYSREEQHYTLEYKIKSLSFCGTHKGNGCANRCLLFLWQFLDVSVDAYITHIFNGFDYIFLQLSFQLMFLTFFFTSSAISFSSVRLRVGWADVLLSDTLQDLVWSPGQMPFPPSESLADWRLITGACYFLTDL